MSPTVSIGRADSVAPSLSTTEPLTKNATNDTTRIAANDDGIALVRRGRNAMMTIVAKTMPNMSQSRVPERKAIVPSASRVLKLPNCAIKITTARPLTNPRITGCGTIRINLPIFKRPTVT